MNKIKESNKSKVTQSSNEVSILSKKVQAALYLNKKIDKKLQQELTNLNLQEHNTMKNLLHKQAELITLQISINEKSPTFESHGITEIANMVNNKSLYISGKWKMVAARAKSVAKKGRLVKKVDFRRGIPEQLEQLKRMCEEENANLFEVIKIINRLKMDRFFDYALGDRINLVL